MDKYTRFNEEQLAEIRKIKLSKIICTNADEIHYIQKHAMDMPDPFLYVKLMICETLICNMLLEFFAEILVFHAKRCLK